MERGDIGLVVQYCSPRQASRLVQRIGRSGHSHLKTPKGVVLCTDEEDRMEALAVARLAHEGFVEKEECEGGRWMWLRSSSRAFYCRKREWICGGCTRYFRAHMRMQ